MLKYILFFALGCEACGPTVLEVSEDSAVSVVEEEQIPEQFGIINTIDCDQKAIGSKVCNMIFYDQNKEVWQLYEQEGKVVILDFSTVWCGPCQNAGHYVQPLQDEYADKINFVTVLVDGVSGEPPTEAEIDQWVSSHNITTAPVLYADRSVLDPTGETGYLVGGFPTYVFIDKNLKIHVGAVGFNEQYVRSVIDSLL
jgi:thiol-disulfide isomerase/thioredoxin